jgi:WD40 repeat protein
LNHIHGYRGFDCRDNLFYLADNESIIYPAAGAGVVHHIRLGTQKFYTNHTDDIISMAVHNGEKYGNIVASGQIGENPTIHIWDAQTRKTLSVLSGKHKRGFFKEKLIIFLQTIIVFRRLFIKFFYKWKIIIISWC